MQAATASPGQVYLHERHFAAALSAAMFLHLMGLGTWMLLPKTPVVEIPVRILNIKLGDAGEEVDIERSIKATPEAANTNIVESELTRFFVPPAPVKLEPMQRPQAKPKPVKLAKPAPLPVKAEPPKPMPAPVAAAAPPAPAQEAPKSKSDAVVQQAQQYVRQQPFDYKPLGAALPQNGGSPVGNSTATQAEILARYEQLISVWIERFKVYPPQARSAGVQGRAVVRIRIDRKGNVRLVTLDQPSGAQMLDQAVLEMIRNANPLPPVPDDYKAGDLFEFKIPISFKL